MRRMRQLSAPHGTACVFQRSLIHFARLSSRQPRPTPSHFLSMRRHTAALAACLLLALACGAKARALAQDPAPGSAAEQVRAAEARQGLAAGSWWRLPVGV